MQLPFSMSEPEIRFTAFASVLVVMGLLEILIPRRALLHAKGRRWLTNLAVIGTSLAVVRGMALLASVIAVPLIALAAAELAGARGWGLLNQVDWPQGLEIALSLVVLDFAIWTQHVVTHKVPLLWRLHRVHHADVDIDVTTALRFHPVEIGLSMLYKVVWVLALGPSALAVLMFEIVLNACAMFSAKWDRQVCEGAARHARYASRAPFRAYRRAQLELRFQPVDLGPPVWHVHRTAARWPRRHDDRSARLPKRSADALSLELAAAVCAPVIAVYGAAGATAVGKNCCSPLILKPAIACWPSGEMIQSTNIWPSLAFTFGCFSGLTKMTP
jgi:Fatty acid hydroxylase superfamily